MLMHNHNEDTLGMNEIISAKTYLKLSTSLIRLKLSIFRTVKHVDTHTHTHTHTYIYMYVRSWVK